MIPTLLLTLALQAAPLHADFHPGEADVYLELSDVGSLLTQLDGAPLVRMLRDERMKPLFELVGESPDRPLKELSALLLAKVAPELGSGTWLDGLHTVSVSFVALGPGSDTEAPGAFLLLADFAGAEQAQALRDGIVRETPKHEPLSAPLPGVELLHTGEQAKDDLWCAVTGTRLVVGSRTSKVEDYAARADKKLAGLASRDLFKKELAAFEKPSGAPLLWFALGRSLTEILKTTMDEDDEQVVSFLEELPADLNPLASPRAARMQMVGERFVTEMIALDDGGAAAQKPIDPAWLEPVPKGSMLVYATAFDGAAAGKEMRALIARDEHGAAALAALEQKLGYGPERVLGRLGPGLTFYTAPPAGPALPDMRVWVDCADPAAFTADYEALIGALGETLPGFTVKTKPYKVKKAGTEEKLEVPVTTLTLPPDLIQIPMLSLSPSYAPVGQRLVFGMSSIDVKNELKRAFAGEGEPIVPGTNALGFAPPADARSVVVMDWGRLIAGILGMVKAFAPMMDPGAMPFDLNKLPPPELFTQYFKPTFHYSKPAAGGVYRRNEASFGPETWLGLFGGSALLGKRMGGSSPGAMPPEEAPLEPPAEGGGN